MLLRLTAGLLLLAGLGRCVRYEYEHEFWLRVDGSGRVTITGRPELWTAFKGVAGGGDREGAALRDAARALLESGGLRVQRAAVTHREGRPYLFVSAEFDDVNRLGGTPAFQDLELSWRRVGDRVVFDGRWRRPAGTPEPQAGDRDGVMAVRFHLPSKVYDHKNAVEGVERGNIVGWRQDVSRALEGEPLAFGATLDQRSILWSTITLFGVAMGVGLGILALVLYLAFRRGRRQVQAPPAS